MSENKEINVKQMNEFYCINDGYGEIGVGFICQFCQNDNMFINPEEEMDCEHCRKTNLFSEKEVEDFKDY